MAGAGLKIIDRSRPVFTLAPNKLTFTIPAAAQDGDILLALLVHKVGEGFTLPAGWESLGAEEGASNAAINYIARVHDVDDADPVAVALLAATDEWQGQLIVIRGGAVATLKYATSTFAFAADATPDIAGPQCDQPVSLLLVTLSAAGAIDFTPPLGTTGDVSGEQTIPFSALDEYTTAVVSQRSLLICWRKAITDEVFVSIPSSGGLAATANPAATGRSFVFVARERPLITPAVLEDPVPGNIGLLPLE